MGPGEEGQPPPSYQEPGPPGIIAVDSTDTGPGDHGRVQGPPALLGALAWAEVGVEGWPRVTQGVGCAAPRPAASSLASRGPVRRGRHLPVPHRGGPPSAPKAPLMPPAPRSPSPSRPWAGVQHPPGRRPEAGLSRSSVPRESGHSPCFLQTNQNPWVPQAPNAPQLPARSRTCHGRGGVATGNTGALASAWTPAIGRETGCPPTYTTPRSRPPPGDGPAAPTGHRRERAAAGGPAPGTRAAREVSAGPSRPTSGRPVGPRATRDTHWPATFLQGLPAPMAPLPTRAENTSSGSDVEPGARPSCGPAQTCLLPAVGANAAYRNCPRPCSLSISETRSPGKPWGRGDPQGPVRLTRLRPEGLRPASQAQAGGRKG